MKGLIPSLRRMALTLSMIDRPEDLASGTKTTLGLHKRYSAINSLKLNRETLL